MKNLPQKLTQKLELRRQENALRSLQPQSDLIDFSSNDYIGFAQSEIIFNATHQFLIDRNIKSNGATGSRLLSGNHELYHEAEAYIAAFHQSENALIFNSGYDANVGFFSSIPQKNDIILFDELCHASIRDGIRLSNAKSYKFQHNDYENLESLIMRFQSPDTQIYIATESVFSMDGDTPDLEKFIALAEQYQAHLVIDEAHALGVFGKNGEGYIQSIQLHDRIFARIITFGKGLGCHGAAILGSTALKEYLVNFARSFIYTTGLSPHAVAAILVAYQHMQNEKIVLEKLRENIILFNRQKQFLGLKPLFIYSKSAIQCAIIPGNEKIKSIAALFQKSGFDVRPILSPTVSEGQERLRFCIHSCNSEPEIITLLELLAKAVL
jgi:8-amino-7-oxononanoate synthase